MNIKINVNILNLNNMKINCRNIAEEQIVTVTNFVIISSIYLSAGNWHDARE